MPRVDVKWERTVSTSGSTRSTAYMATNKLIVHDGVLYATWLDAPGRVMVAAFRASDGEEVVPPRLLHEGLDNHCGAALTADRDGYFHAMCGSHNEVPFAHKVSREPWDIEHWWPARAVSDNPTYPSMVCDAENRLHVTYRWWTGSGSHTAVPSYHIPPTAAYQRTLPRDTWERIGHPKEPFPLWTDPASLVSPLVPNGYAQFGSSLAIDVQGRLHLGFHVYDQTFNFRGHTAGYLRSDDGGETWCTAAGEQVGIPAGAYSVDILESDFRAGYSKDDRSLLDIRVSNVAVNADGNPLLVAFHRETGNGRLWEHDGTAWRHTDLLPILRESGSRAFSMDGSLTVDADGNTYVAAQTVNAAGSWGSDDAEVVLYFRPAGTDEWQVTQISETDPAVANWHPSLERITSPFQHMGTPHLLYQHGTKGGKNDVADKTDVRLVGLAVV